jgi:hypothetical protein
VKPGGSPTEIADKDVCYDPRKGEFGTFDRERGRDLSVGKCRMLLLVVGSCRRRYQVSGIRYHGQKVESLLDGGRDGWICGFDRGGVRKRERMDGA